MEEKEAIAKAMKDLQELYNGIPDDSVDLTFKYLTATDDQQQNQIEKRKNGDGAEPSIVDHSPELGEPATVGRDQIKREIAQGDANQREGLSCSRSKGTEQANQRQRKGIPHSNICALCSSYIHVFRHRCLVCGRVYCKNCVGMGMGKMAEGRKCKECLGRRLSQRYIKSAGKSGCCFGYSNEVKQQELIWAEKGPSTSREGKNTSGLNPSSQNSNMPVDRQRPRARNGPTFIVTRSPGFYTGSHGLPLQGK